MNKAQVKARILARRRIASDPPNPPTLNGHCWIWSGATNTDGYGQIRIGGKCYYVHRVSCWLWLDMPLDSALMGRHRCINQPACYNPSHLRVGTKGDNNRDIVAQGRHRNLYLTSRHLSNLVSKVRRGKMSISKWAALNECAYSTALNAYKGVTHRAEVEMMHARLDSVLGSADNPFANKSPAPILIVPAGCKIDSDGMVYVDDPIAAGVADDDELYGCDSSLGDAFDTASCPAAELVIVGDLPF